MSLADLSRAGRLDPERVALAAYLGDRQARECRPPAALRVYAAGASRWSAVRRVLRHGGLNRQAVLPLLCDMAARALDVAGDDREACEGAIQAARDWAACPCDQHQRMAEYASELLEDMHQAGEPAWLDQLDVDMVGHARWAGALAAAGGCAAEAAFAPLPGIPPAGERIAKAAVDAAAEPAREDAWQADYLARHLLDPDWPCPLDGPT